MYIIVCEDKVTNNGLHLFLYDLGSLKHFPNMAWTDSGQIKKAQVFKTRKKADRALEKIKMWMKIYKSQKLEGCGLEKPKVAKLHKVVTFEVMP